MPLKELNGWINKFICICSNCQFIFPSFNGIEGIEALIGSKLTKNIAE